MIGYLLVGLDYDVAGLPGRVGPNNSVYLFHLPRKGLLGAEGVDRHISPLEVLGDLGLRSLLGRCSLRKKRETIKYALLNI